MNKVGAFVVVLGVLGVDRGLGEEYKKDHGVFGGDGRRSICSKPEGNHNHKYKFLIVSDFTRLWAEYLQVACTKDFTWSDGGQVRLESTKVGGENKTAKCPDDMDLKEAVGPFCMGGVDPVESVLKNSDLSEYLKMNLDKVCNKTVSDEPNVPVPKKPKIKKGRKSKVSIEGNGCKEVSMETPDKSCTFDLQVDGKTIANFNCTVTPPQENLPAAVKHSPAPASIQVTESIPVPPGSEVPAAAPQTLAEAQVKPEIPLPVPEELKTAPPEAPKPSPEPPQGTHSNEKNVPESESRQLPQPRVASVETSPPVPVSPKPPGETVSEPPSPAVPTQDTIGDGQTATGGNNVPDSQPPEGQEESPTAGPENRSEESAPDTDGQSGNENDDAEDVNIKQQPNTEENNNKEGEITKEWKPDEGKEEPEDEGNNGTTGIAQRFSRHGFPASAELKLSHLSLMAFL